MKILRLSKICNFLFSTNKKIPKIPQIKQIKHQWNEFSKGYSKFDLGPQTFYYSFLSLMQLENANNILQVACGSGKLIPLAIQLKKTQSNYRAVDLSKNMVQLTKSNLKQNFLKYQSKLTFQEWCSKQNLYIQQANAQQKFQNLQKKFDRIICNCVIMLTQNPQVMLKNLYQHAEKGCLMGVSVWGNKDQNNLMSSIRQSILQSGFQLPNQRSNFHLYKKLGHLAEKVGWKTKLNWQQNHYFRCLNFLLKNIKSYFNIKLKKCLLNSNNLSETFFIKKFNKYLKIKKDQIFPVNCIYLKSDVNRRGKCPILNLLDKQFTSLVYIFSNLLICQFIKYLQMASQQQATIQQAIHLLQSLLSGQSQSSGLKMINIPDFDSQINAFCSKSKKLQPEIQLLTQIFSKAVNCMKQILSYSQVCKKYSTEQQEKLKNIFMNLSKDTQSVQKKNPNFIDHSRAIRQLLSAAFWVFTNVPEIIIKGAIQAADFNALKFQKKKNLQHNDWYKSVTTACRHLENYAVKNYTTGLVFKFNGQDKWNQILSGSGNISNQNTINSAKKVEPVLQKAKQATQTQKVPKKQFFGLNLQIKNYQNSQIKLGANQLQMKNGVFIQNCSNCAVKIEGKFKSLNLNKCQNIILVIQSCVSGVEIMNSKKINLTVKQKSPSIAVDKSQNVKIVLNQKYLDCDIVSSKANQLNVSFQCLNGDQSKDYLISDQLITKWNANKKKFQTAVYDKFL